MSEKYLCRNLFLINFQVYSLQLYKKKNLTHLFSCEFCNFFKDNYFAEHVQTVLHWYFLYFPNHFM